MTASAELLVIFGLFGLKLPIHAHFGGVLGHITGFPLELNWIPAQGVKNYSAGIPDGREKIKIGLAVLTQYRRVTDRQKDSHIASTALCYASRGENACEGILSALFSRNAIQNRICVIKPVGDKSSGNGTDG